MQGVFKGWIPTVTGSLSFSAIGLTEGQPERCVTANVSDGRNRYIICYQFRYLGDSVLPRWLVRWLMRRPWALRRDWAYDGDMWFVCIARALPDSAGGSEYLRGRLFLTGSKEQWEEVLKPLIRQSQSQLEACRPRHPSISTNVHVQFGGIYETLERNLASLSHAHMTFAVARNGEATLTLDPSQPAPASAPTSPTGMEQHFQRSITSQFFFFLKDIFHQHQHHDSRTDAILDIYPAADPTDQQWRRETLYALYRKIISYKRKCTEKNLFSAQGVLAYAQSFHHVSHRQDMAADGLPTYNTEALETSLQAARDERVWKNERGRQRRGTFQAVFLAVVGLIISAAGLLQVFPAYPPGQSAPPSSTLLRMAMEFLATRTEETIVALVLAFVFFGIDFKGNSLLRKGVLLVQYYKRKVAAGILLGCALLLGAGLLYFALAT